MMFTAAVGTLALATPAIPMSSPAHLPVDRPPNVIVILTDDMGWGDLGIHGNKLIDTPHLDALAKNSARFESFYVHPVCAPTRASFLTGRHFLRTGVSHVHGGRDFLHPGEVTIAEWFRANGYATGMWGKWHSGGADGYRPWDRGFDEAYSARLYAHKDGAGELNGKPVQTPGWTTDVLTDMAIAFIEKNKDRAFFAYIPHLAPHTPLVAKEELIAKYKGRGLGDSMAAAFAMVEMVDDSVGRLMKRLEELGLADNTAVLFFSDNGPQFFGYEKATLEEYALRNPGGFKGHKGSMWENGIKVPFFFHMPSRIQPREIPGFADVHDLLPTLVELCALKAPPREILPFDGRSFLPVLESGNPEDLPPKVSVIASNSGWRPIKPDEDVKDLERPEYAPVPPESRDELAFEAELLGLRTEDYKLLRNPGYAEGAPASFGNEVLVNIASDPTESTNRAAVEPERAGEMRAQLEKWFDVIRRESHAFHAPRFTIGPDRSNEVYLYAPARRLGKAYNSDLWSSDWTSPGDGGEYLIRVTDAGDYSVKLTARKPFENPATLTFQVGERILFEPKVESWQTPPKKPAESNLGIISLPAGEHTLRVFRKDGTSSPGSERLSKLVFEPASAR